MKPNATMHEVEVTTLMSHILHIKIAHVHKNHLRKHCPEMLTLTRANGWILGLFSLAHAKKHGHVKRMLNTLHTIKKKAEQL